MNCVWCTWDVTPGTLLLSAAVQSERLWRCSQRPCGEHPASWMVTQLKRELGVWWRRPVHQQHLPKNTPSSERESFCLKGTVHLKNTRTCSVIYPSKLFCCEFRVVCPLSLWCSKSYSNAFEKNSTTMSPSKNLERSLKITCRPCCEPEQMKEQFIQKNQECLFPSLPQFLEIVLMWVLQISALKMSASSQMWYHQICSVFILLVLRGFVSLCFSLLPTHFQSRPWRRWRTSPRGGLWSGRRRRRAPATWARWLTLRHLETRCPGTCPNTIAWSAPSQPPETCWTRQRGPSSALQVRCFTRKENRSRSVCEGDVRVCPLFIFMFCSSAHFKNSAVPLLLRLVVHGALRKEVLAWSIHHSTRGGLW